VRRFWIAGCLLLGALAAFAFVGSALADHDDDKDHNDHPAPPASIAFQAVLTGRAEVPPTTSTGVGLATFLLSKDGATLSYGLQVTGPSSPIGMAHIHLGHRGQNGAIVANLCGAGNAPGCTSEGVVATGSITAASLVNSLAGHSLNDLLSAIHSGNAYANVHTANFPNGELRGQVLPLGAVARAAHEVNDDHHDDHDDDHGGHGHDDSDS
jgi:hypothetical protein